MSDRDTPDHQLLVDSVVLDLQARMPLDQRRTNLFRDEAHQYLRQIAGRSARPDVDLRLWAKGVWEQYKEEVAAEQAERLAAEEAERCAREALLTERRDRFWTSPRARPDAAELRRMVEARGIAHVYHWTEADNLESILQHGICSRSRLDALGITVRAHSYGSPLKEAQLRGYVGVMLRPHEGMIAKAADPIVLELEPGVLAVEGALFVGGNSARSDIDLRTPAQLSSLAAFEDLFEEPEGNRLRDWQAEVWIPHVISPIAIKAVAARLEHTHARLQQARERLFDNRQYPVEVVHTDAWNMPSTLWLIESLSDEDGSESRDGPPLTSA